MGDLNEIDKYTEIKTEKEIISTGCFPKVKNTSNNNIEDKRISIENNYGGNNDKEDIETMSKLRNKVNEQVELN